MLKAGAIGSIVHSRDARYGEFNPLEEVLDWISPENVWPEERAWFSQLRAEHYVHFSHVDGSEGASPATLLNFAVADNQLDKLTDVLKMDSLNIDAQDARGCTALHHATKKGFVSAVELLILNRAQSNCQNDLGRTPLHHAAFYKASIASLVFLLNHGADTSIQDKGGNTVWHFCACRLEAVHALIAQNDSVSQSVSQPNNEGLTPLLLAVQGNELVCVKELIKYAEDVSISDNKGFSLIHWAARKADPILFRCVLASGSDPNGKGIDGSQACHCLFDEESISAEWLSEALHIQQHKPDILLDLNGVNDIVNPRRDGMTPLLICLKGYFNSSGAYANSPETVQILEKLVRSMPDLAQVGQYGRTALHWFCLLYPPIKDSCTWRDIFGVVLNKSSQLHLEDEDGNKPIALLIGTLERCTEEVAAHIRSYQHGIFSPRASDINDLLFDFLKYIGHDQSLKIRVQGRQLLSKALHVHDENFIKNVLSLSPNVDMRDDDEKRYNPLEHACMLGSSSRILDALFSRSKALTSMNPFGNTLFSYASMKSHPHVVESLLKAGLGVSCLDAEGRTALHLAAFENAPVVIQMLLDRGADVCALDYFGWTAAHYACETGSSEALRLLTKGISNWDRKVKVFVMNSPTRWTPLQLAAAATE